MILKPHRSADDSLFLSPKVPELRKANSIPLSSTTTKSYTKSARLPDLPRSHGKVLVAQQRHSILTAVNGVFLYPNE